MKTLGFILITTILSVENIPVRNDYGCLMRDPVVQRFREYLQIDTSNSENLEYAIEFWRRQAKEADLPIIVFYQPNGKPVVVITVAGEDPALPSIMLNSHIDVVPAVESEWIHPPFAAFMDRKGDIISRGTQDTKDVSIQYLEAVKRLRRDNVTLLRTLHLTFMPDEETGGFQGIKLFIDTEEYKNLNIGFALDEGLASLDDTMKALYSDKRPWQLEFTVYGDGGHGSTLAENTAIEKAQKLMNKISEYRDTQRKLMKSLDDPNDLRYTSININIIRGGYATNIIPTKVTVTVDMRLATNANIPDVEKMVNSWLQASGNDTELKYIRRDDYSAETDVSDSNPYWVAMRGALNDMGYNVTPIVCPATSDMLVLRNRGLPAIGFSPKIRTTTKMHAKDEYQNVDVFLNGIDVYYKVIKSLANV